jgi:hypothetical protein
MIRKQLLLLATLVVACATAVADGGTVQFRRTAGSLVITVFTAPEHLSTGPADFSVLLQSRDTLEPVLDAGVSLLFTRPDSTTKIQVQATRAQAQNKLLYAAPVNCAQPGKWELAIAVMRNGKRSDATGSIELASSQELAGSYWSYIAFPPVMIVLFVLREGLVRRKAKR